MKTQVMKTHAGTGDRGDYRKEFCKEARDLRHILALMSGIG